MPRPHAPSPGEVALGLTSLGSILSTSTSMGRALETFETLAPPRWRPHLDGIGALVRNGASLTGALTGSTLRLPPSVLGVMRAGEERGDLASAVHEAAALAEDEASARQAIAGALAYPAILAATGVVTLVIMATVVVPRFAELFAESSVAMPRSTRLVLAAGGIVARWGPMALLGMAILGVGVAIGLRDERHRGRLHHALLQLPLVGPLRHRIATARVARTLGGLLDAGIPLSRALGIAAEVSGDLAVRDRLRAARAAIIAGDGAARALTEHRALAPATLRLTAVGETTGKLGGMLRHAGDIEQRTAGQMIRASVRIAEPLLVATVGGMVAMVAGGLLQAMYAIRP